MIDEIIDELLRHRGIAPAEAEAFLNPKLADLAKPCELPGIVEAADVILSAIAARRRIVVFGDYDCDGVSATAILVRAISAITGGGEETVAAFLPDRLTEGYGMSDASVARMLKEYGDVALVVTVDNGINSVGQIGALKAKGIGVVVTDHHLPSFAKAADGQPGEMLLPPAEAIVNPKVASPEKLSELCGAGVAFLLANQLVTEATKRGLYSGPGLGGPLLVLAGLATVTDIMPLIGQNRILVAEALRHFHAWAPLGIRELHARAARSTAARLTSKDFSFMLGPRINAAGRLKSGMEALELLLSDDREIARECARIVDLHNTERKAIELKMTDEAMAKVVPNAVAQVIDLPDGHPGVAGIVAARVLERLGGGVPVCVQANGHGSARSPDGLNIRDAFVACDQYLTTYGGHAAAGGFSVKPGQIDAFREALCDYCRKAGVKGETSGVKTGPELWLAPSDVTIALAEALEKLEPFGEANEEPVLGLKDVRLADVKTIGADGRHLSVAIASAQHVRAVWWGHGALAEELRTAGATPHDVTFNLIVSEYGERHVELRVINID